MRVLHGVFLGIFTCFLLSRHLNAATVALSTGSRNAAAKPLDDDIIVTDRHTAIGEDDVKMLSETQFHVTDIGDSLRLECTFRSAAYNLFDYPVIWRKQQLTEWTQINVMGSLNKPFVSTDRFEVTFISTAPRYVFELTISDIIRNDSGNYSCEVRGPHSILLAEVIHHLFVRAPVERVLVLGGLSTTTANSIADTNATSRSPGMLRVVEGSPSRLRCVALGGYPPPSLDLYVGRRDVTAHLTFSNTASLSHGGLPGMRRIHFRSERSTESFVASADEDGSLLRCVVGIPGSTPFVETVRLDVEYSPKISCSPSEVHVGDRDVILECYVRAKPALTALFWIVDANGTTQAHGDVTENRIVITKERDDATFHSRVVIRQVGAEDCRTYTIVAENPIALSTKEVDLQLIHLTVTTATRSDLVRSPLNGIHQTSAIRRGSQSSSLGSNRPRDASGKSRPSMFSNAGKHRVSSFELYFTCVLLSLLTYWRFFRWRTTSDEERKRDS